MQSRHESQLVPCVELVTRPVSIDFKPEIHPLALAFPPLQKTELQALAEDIKKWGLREPIVLYQGKILDGRSRYEACILCGQRPEFVEYTGESPREYVRSANLRRRHMTVGQSAATAVFELNQFIVEARNRRLATLKKGNYCPNKGNTEGGRALALAGKAYNCNPTYIDIARKLHNEANDLFLRLWSGELKMPAARRALRERQARVSSINVPTNEINLHGIEARSVDFRVAEKELTAGSVDLVLTDPPFDKESLEIWGDLSQVCARILRPGGYLVTLSGKYFLPEVMGRLSRYLDYFWTACMSLEGANGTRHDRGIREGWWPILIYFRPPFQKPARMMMDVIPTGGRDTRYHKFGQRPEFFGRLLNQFTEKGDSVCDFFGGGGSVAVACRELKRRCFVCESDPENYKILVSRLKEPSRPLEG